MSFLLGYGTPGLTVDFLVYDSIGNVFNLASMWFESWEQYGTLASYRLPATEVAAGSGRYTLDTATLNIPAVTAAGIFSYELRKRGATLSDSTVLWVDNIAQDVILQQLGLLYTVVPTDLQNIQTSINTMQDVVNRSRTVLSVSGSTVQMMFVTPSSPTCYYAILNAAGQIYNGTAFVTIALGSWSTFCRNLTQPTTSGGSTNIQLRSATFPSIPPGTYFLVGYVGWVFGGRNTDPPQAMIAVKWDGVTLSQVALPNLLTGTGTSEAFTGQALINTPTPSGSGTGPYTVTVPVKDSLGAALQGVSVSATLNGVGYQATSNTTGATFNLIAGTYTLAAFMSGYQYGGGTLVVAGNATAANLVMTARTIPAPAAAGDTTAYLTTLDNSEQPVDGITLYYWQTSPPVGAGHQFKKAIRSAISAGGGLWQAPMAKGATYEIGATSGVADLTVRVPANAGTSFALPNFKA